MAGLRVSTFCRFKLPSSVFATARSKAVRLVCFVYLLFYCLVHLVGFQQLFKVSIVIFPCPNLNPFFLSFVPKCTANLLYARCLQLYYFLS